MQLIREKERGGKEEGREEARENGWEGGGSASGSLSPCPDSPSTILPCNFNCWKLLLRITQNRIIQPLEM